MGALQLLGRLHSPVIRTDAIPLLPQQAPHATLWHLWLKPLTLPAVE